MDERGAHFGQYRLGVAVRRPRPDVVVADQRPFPRPVAALKPLHRRAELLRRGIADREHAEAALAAFVERGVDVGDAAPDDPGQALPDRADVHPHDGVDGARLDQRTEEVLHRRRRFDGGIEDEELHVPAGDPVAPVELVGRDLRAGDAGRPPDPRRAAHRDQQGDAKGVRGGGRGLPAEPARSPGARPRRTSFTPPFAEHVRVHAALDGRHRAFQVRGSCRHVGRGAPSASGAWRHRSLRVCGSCRRHPGNLPRRAGTHPPLGLELRQRIRAFSVVTASRPRDARIRVGHPGGAPAGPGVSSACGGLPGRSGRSLHRSAPGCPRSAHPRAGAPFRPDPPPRR